MITAIAIENFKGVGARQRVELKPITLLFGANSAGKSTVLHALHYAREIFERRHTNADRTLAGGPHVDLGGFESFVHGQDLSAQVVLRFDLDLTQRSLPDYGLDRAGRLRMGLPEAGVNESLNAGELTALLDSIDFSADVNSAWVEVAVAWSEFLNTSYVASYTVGLNGTPLATIDCDLNRRESWLSNLNTKHPLFRPGLFGPGEYCGSEDDSVADYWILQAHGADLNEQPIYLEGQADALPRWGKLLSLLLKRVESMDPDAIDYNSDEARSIGLEASLLAVAVTQLLVGPGEILREELAKVRYLGPLRTTPSRAHRAPRYHEPSRWAEGLAAWDLLHSRGVDFVDEVGAWLSREDRLDTGYALFAWNYREVGDVVSRLLAEDWDGDRGELAIIRDEIERAPVKRRLLLLDRVSFAELVPHDVGVGIAQLIPVVVLALDGDTEFAAIEQPELHVHPRIQVGLGDLLIWGVTQKPTARFLVETHSEHLLLRLLRRIRETHEGELKAGEFPSLDPGQVSVVFVEKDADGSSRFTPLRIDETGEFIDRWPQGFFEERAEELF